MARNAFELDPSWQQCGRHGWLQDEPTCWPCLEEDAADGYFAEIDERYADAHGDEK